MHVIFYSVHNVKINSSMLLCCQGQKKNVTFILHFSPKQKVKTFSYLLLIALFTTLRMESQVECITLRDAVVYQVE